ncbi:unnamed protein product [Amoebophrya sp. A25]|nr:unnamed protein product [Amoebophrya sp. A25]|eukprot:GSA25T00013454001.1
MPFVERTLGRSGVFWMRRTADNTLNGSILLALKRPQCAAAVKAALHHQFLNGYHIQVFILGEDSEFCEETEGMYLDPPLSSATSRVVSQPPTQQLCTLPPAPVTSLHVQHHYLMREEVYPRNYEIPPTCISGAQPQHQFFLPAAAPCNSYDWLTTTTPLPGSDNKRSRPVHQKVADAYEEFSWPFQSYRYAEINHAHAV